MLDINVKDVSLVLEGGTFRTVFTMGILDAFLDEGIMMPHISGVSAGAVLVVAIGAAIIGLVIFVPRILNISL